MSIDNLYDFFKKINYRRILPVLLCPVLLLCTSISGFAVDFFYNQESFRSPIRLYVDGSSVGDYVNVTFSYNVYHFNNSSQVVTRSVHFIFESSWDLQFDFEDFDYYIYSVVDGDNYTGFLPDSVSISDYNSEGSRVYTSLLNPIFTPYNGRFEGDNMYGFSVFAKIPSNYYRPVSSLIFYGSGSLTSNVDLTIFCIQVSKGTDSVALNGIISAINNQTDNIMDAGSGFGGTTSGIQSGNDELSGFIDDYTEVEQSMYDKFTENQTAVSGNFSGWSWGSLSSAVDWTSDYLNRIYDNSGDFRTMFMYPILAGIALIFIGRQGLTAYVRSRREK